MKGIHSQRSLKFIQLAKKKKIKELKEIWNNDADKLDINMIGGKEGIGALHHGVLHSDLEMVKWLLSINCNVCLPSKEDGQTPIHVAAMKGNLEILKLLIEFKHEERKATNEESKEESQTETNEKKAPKEESQTETEEKKAPKEESKEESQTETKPEETDKKVESTEAAERPKKKVKLPESQERTMLERINFQDNHGWSSLHFAVQSDSMECLEYLLSQGGDMNQVDKKKRNLLQFCVSDMKKIPQEMIKTLLSTKQCKVNNQDKDKRTCLHLTLAHPECNKEVLRMLVAAGADIHKIQDKRKMTPIKLANEMKLNDLATFMEQVYDAIETMNLIMANNNLQGWPPSTS